MKVKVTITQKTLYEYNGKDDSYSDTLHLELDSLEAAKIAVDSFPAESVENIEASIKIALKDFDMRKPTEDGEDS